MLLCNRQDIELEERLARQQAECLLANIIGLVKSLKDGSKLSPPLYLTEYYRENFAFYNAVNALAALHGMRHGKPSSLRPTAADVEKYEAFNTAFQKFPSIAPTHDTIYKFTREVEDLQDKAEESLHQYSNDPKHARFVKRDAACVDGFSHSDDELDGIDESAEATGFAATDLKNEVVTEEIDYYDEDDYEPETTSGSSLLEDLMDGHLVRRGVLRAQIKSIVPNDVHSATRVLQFIGILQESISAKREALLSAQETKRKAEEEGEGDRKKQRLS